MNSLYQQGRGVLDKAFYFNKAGQIIKWTDCISIEKEYWSAVFKNIRSHKYKFIVTENCKLLPEYGEYIIVLLKSDEFNSKVEYISDVKAVFRNYFDVKYLFYRNIFFVPLPYLGHINFTPPLIPIMERDIDIFFAGQITHSDRKTLSDVISQFQLERNDLNIVFYKTENFFTGLNIHTYLQYLEQSKIALCPRGASIETYRHFESLRHGCVAISTPLPDVWYLHGSPIQIINQWGELPILFNNLFDKDKKHELDYISNIGATFWERKLSPVAVANYIDDSIKTLI